MSAIVVWGSVALGLAFVLIWLASADVRQRLERPKHRFQDHLKRYDRSCHD